MHRNRYTQEIGVDADIKIVPLPYALLLFGVVAVAIWYGAGLLQSRFDERQAAKKLSVAVEAPARTSVAKK